MREAHIAQHDKGVAQDDRAAPSLAPAPGPQ